MIPRVPNLTVGEKFTDIGKTKGKTWIKKKSSVLL